MVVLPAGGTAAGFRMLHRGNGRSNQILGFGKPAAQQLGVDGDPLSVLGVKQPGMNADRYTALASRRLAGGGSVDPMIETGASICQITTPVPDHLRNPWAKPLPAIHATDITVAVIVTNCDELLPFADVWVVNPAFS